MRKPTEVSQKNNLHTKESRISLTKMIMRLFDLWQIPMVDQAVLLNRSTSTIRRYRNGGCFADDKDIHDRVGNLLSIHMNVKILLGEDEGIVYKWVGSQNRAFEYQTPVTVMKKGLDGMIAVRNYLEFHLHRASCKSTCKDLNINYFDVTCCNN